MNYGVIWSRKSIDFLNKLESLTSKRIIKYIKEFSENPGAKEFRRLKGESAFRLRVGDYRVIFDFDKKNKRINIVKIGHRKNIYN
ncbi:MAG: type II toxin-antitoxin system RelE/ParE family toxin [Candidatus Pacearchaeota archaeon]|nr:type II toxin-antitoxin system RelE/ParE family toxin [Candidatus Pacearchaeota archaeon]